LADTALLISVILCKLSSDVTHLLQHTAHPNSDEAVKTRVVYEIVVDMHQALVAHTVTVHEAVPKLLAANAQQAAS
jgi:hypothetical protein